MKKVVAILLLLTLAISLFGCGAKPEQTATGNQLYLSDYTVTNPMQVPDYTFDHEPTPDEMRQMAVKAMRDMLSIEWCTPKFMMYRKTGAAGGKDYTYAPGVTYAGLPYTNGDSAIWNWFDFYNTETGVLEFEGDGYAFNDVLGNTCTGSIMWGWSVVCDSLDGDYTNFQMTRAHGCIPLGDITYPEFIDTFNDYSTALIIDQNGDDVILEAYALCLPADGLSSHPQDHGMMVIEPAHVVRFEDGSIDPEESYLIIQDQRGGVGAASYTIEENGEKHYYTGRTYAKFTFQELLDQDYIPCTTAEFAGLKPYTKASVEFDNGGAEVTDLKSLMMGTVKSSYPICNIRAIAVDDAGNEVQVGTKYLTKREVRNGTARECPMSYCTDKINASVMEDALEAGKTYTLRLEVTASTGESFTPVSFTVTG